MGNQLGFMGGLGQGFAQNANPLWEQYGRQYEEFMRQRHEYAAEAARRLYYPSLDDLTRLQQVQKRAVQQIPIAKPVVTAPAIDPSAYDDWFKTIAQPKPQEKPQRNPFPVWNPDNRLSLMQVGATSDHE